MKEKDRKMSQNEDNIKESKNSSESSSEESVFEDETICSTRQNISHSSDEDIVPYANDPLADPAWTAEYGKEMKEDEELEKALKDRLMARVGVDTW